MHHQNLNPKWHPLVNLHKSIASIRIKSYGAWCKWDSTAIHCKVFSGYRRSCQNSYNFPLLHVNHKMEHTVILWESCNGSWWGCGLPKSVREAPYQPMIDFSKILTWFRFLILYCSFITQTPRFWSTVSTIFALFQICVSEVVIYVSPS